MEERKVKTVANRDVYKVPQGLFDPRRPNKQATECFNWPNYEKEMHSVHIKDRSFEEGCFYQISPVISVRFIIVVTIQFSKTLVPRFSQLQR
jgi:hypothetical protein